MLELFIAALLLGIILGGLIIYFLLNRRQNSGIGEPAAERFSEKAAENLLNKYGYQIVSKQPKRSIITRFQGKDHFSFSEADYLVRKNKKKYLVIVHSGEAAFDPNQTEARRKLIEHQHIFEPEGLLVMDLSTGELTPITFQFPNPRSIDALFQYLIIIFIIVFVIGIIWLAVQLHLF